MSARRRARRGADKKAPVAAWAPPVDPWIADRGVYSWESQASQYPLEGPVGISYFAGVIPEFGTVDCLLFRGEDGLLLGILNHYPIDMGPEQAGNVNTWVHPKHRRQRIATRLHDEARRRWGINYQQQRYSADGSAFVSRYMSGGASARITPAGICDRCRDESAAVAWERGVKSFEGRADVYREVYDRCHSGDTKGAER